MGRIPYAKKGSKTSSFLSPIDILQQQPSQQQISELLKIRPHTVYGIHAEKMFGHIAKMLGKCKSVKQIDSGKAASPDYHLKLKNGRDIFVEVKNCHVTQATSKFILKGSHISKILSSPKYPLEKTKIAIHWSKWGVWTLLSLENFKKNKNNYEVNMLDAMLKNEMRLLGDQLICCVPPLTIEMILEITSQEKIDETHTTAFCVIKDILIKTGKGLVKNKSEANLIFLLAQYLSDSWEEREYSEITDTQVTTTYEYTPSEPQENETALLDTLSQIVARIYKGKTSPQGTLIKLDTKYNNFFLKIKRKKLEHLQFYPTVLRAAEIILITKNG